MIVLYRDPKESNEKLISRFQKKVQGKRILSIAKERMYFKKPSTKRYVRNAAMMREHYRDLREKKKYR
ncbi:30S ribosomal protein S21 [Candidatus Peregrinibacteria bacterium CG_4_9_14_0_2_um_filter_53_11]|nr:MAG: 30S ribosomal protein S21 [Candidatus Peregrinibacteria bacterium CG_4_9_14_0_2_um_filter_53_11]